MINSAFIGFQLGAGGDKNFGQYLESLGLSESTRDHLPKISKEETLAKAKRIREKIRGIKK